MGSRKGIKNKVGDDARFWGRVVVQTTKTRPMKTPCWLWTGAADEHGYGRFWLNGKTRLAHRVSWYMRFGAWPEDELDHLCRVPACVNPRHLKDGSHAENLSRIKRPEVARCGHPFTYTEKSGTRRCKTCRYARQRRKQASHKVPRGRAT